MHKTLEEVILLFWELRNARQDLQGEFRGCLKKFTALERGKPLTVRAAHASDGAIRGVYLAMRLSGSVRHGHRSILLLKHVKGRVTPGLIYEVARDHSHLEQWLEADATRVELNARAAAVNLAARDLRHAFANKFSHRSAAVDHAKAARILRVHPWLTAGDYEAVLGLAVYDRRLGELENEIIGLTREWKRELLDFPLEPFVRWSERGILHLTWAFVKRICDAKGLYQVQSTAIPGRISDRWLRTQPTLGSARRRKVALWHAMKLRLLLLRYSELLVLAARLKSKVHGVLYAQTDTAPSLEDRDVGYAGPRSAIQCANETRSWNFIDLAVAAGLRF
jgi:hypothetical protein